MPAKDLDTLVVTEAVLARLTVAAYGVALRHGLQRPFLEVELDMWRTLKVVHPGGKPSHSVGRGCLPALKETRYVVRSPSGDFILK